MPHRVRRDYYHIPEHWQHLVMYLPAGEEAPSRCSPVVVADKTLILVIELKVLVECAEDQLVDLVTYLGREGEEVDA